MRALIVSVALVSALSVAQAQGPNVAIIFQENWPVLKTNSGMSHTAEVDFVPHGATARDGDYPEIGLTDTVKVVNNGTRNVLSGNSDFQDAGVIWDRVGTVTGPANFPNWYDATGPIFAYADYNITTATLDANSYALLLGLNMSTNARMYAALNFWTPTEIHIELRALTWFGDPTIDEDSYIIDRSVLENKRIRFRLDWQAGTVNEPGTGAAADGYVTLTAINLDTLVETVIYSFTNKKIFLSSNGELIGGGMGSVPGWNHLSGGQVGYFGLIGENEQFVIATEVPDPAPGELMGTTPEPCCGGGGGESATGPILPAIDPTWTGACTGGGTVPTASDLTDSENWDD